MNFWEGPLTNASFIVGMAIALIWITWLVAYSLDNRQKKDREKIHLLSLLIDKVSGERHY